MKIVITGLFLFYNCFLYSQNLFFLETTFVVNGSETSIYSYDINNCAIVLEYTMDTIFQLEEGSPYALAARNDSILYIINADATIFEINIVAQTANVVYVGSEDVFFGGVTGAVFDNEQNKLFLSRNRLFSFDFGTLQFKDHGLFNPSVVYVIDDLIFNEGKLIGAGVADLNQVAFFDINIENPFFTSEYTEWTNCYNANLASTFSSCENPNFYSSVNGNLVTLDQDLNFCEVVCSIGFFADFASPSEGNGSVCSIAIDLDEDNSTQTIGINDYADTLACVLDSIFPFDGDIAIRPAFLEYDSLVVSQLDHFTSIDLATDYVGPLAVIDRGNSYTFYAPSADVSSEEFGKASRSIRLSEAGSTLATPAAITVGYQVFRDTIRSDTAYAFIEVMELEHNAGIDLDTFFCSTTSEVDLVNIIGGEENGTWLPMITNSPIFDPQVDPAGEYMYVISGSLCPSDSAEVVINIETAPTIDLGVDTTVCSDSYTLSVMEATGVTYFWSDDSDGETIEVNESGLYYVEATHICGITIDSILIDFVDMEDLSLPSKVSLCEGDSLELDLELNGTYDILWSSGDVSSSIFIDTAGLYSVTVTTACTDTILEVEALKEDLPVGTGLTTVLLCPEESLDIGVTGEVGMSYLWNTGEELSTIEVGESGLYLLTVSNTCGHVQDSFMVDQLTPLGNPLSENYIICDDEPLTVAIDGDYNDILWNTGDTTSKLEITEGGYYYATVIDDCETYIFETEVAFCENTSIYIPTIFTPNDDGLNDNFYIGNPNNQEITNFTIYDRWGNEVYVWKDKSEGIEWDGLRNGQRIQAGVYAYMLEIDEKSVRSGTITIVR